MGGWMGSIQYWVISWCHSGDFFIFLEHVIRTSLIETCEISSLQDTVFFTYFMNFILMTHGISTILTPNKLCHHWTKLFKNHNSFNGYSDLHFKGHLWWWAHGPALGATSWLSWLPRQCSASWAPSFYWRSHQKWSSWMGPSTEVAIF